MSEANGEAGRPELPKGWEWRKLTGIGAWVGGGTPSKQRVEYWEGGTVPWVSPKDMKKWRLEGTQDVITEAAVEASAVKRFPANSVAVVVRSGILEHTLPIALVPFEATANQDLRVVSPEKGIDPQWLLYALQADAESIRRACTKDGTTVASIDVSKLVEWSLAVPSLPEQQRLVRVIEGLFDRIDAAQDDLQGVLARAGRLGDALIESTIWGRRFWTDEPHQVEKLLATERRASWEERTAGRGSYQEPEDPLAPVAPPEGWAIVSVDAVCSLITDGDHNPPKRQPEGIAHLTAKHVHGYSLHTEGSTFISEPDFERTKRRYGPQAGDVILTCVGTIGRVAVVPERFTFSPDRNLAGLRPLPSINPRFLMYVMASRTLQRRMSTASGSTAQPHLYLGDLRRLPVPVPPLSVQDVVVESLDGRLAAYTQMLAQLRVAERHGNSLRRSTLAEVFAGGLATGTPLAHSGAPPGAAVIGTKIESLG
jgi:type I restriction enzyme S subunit